ncbi:hypothetical protein [Nitrincola tapanii]|uniref:Uncharacterized protein n=1 Tax=Nitrincola tapanii TaxID=1708751 RepID=A0A5A9W4I0_9GAMM|nr:hypothetical protein [Nitrincola tapanii]KAA0874978.1 hypothetical protein E1H14_06015 [Nitrincola tapanii]
MLLLSLQRKKAARAARKGVILGTVCGFGNAFFTAHLQVGFVAQVRGSDARPWLAGLSFSFGAELFKFFADFSGFQVSDLFARVC